MHNKIINGKKLANNLLDKLTIEIQLLKKHQLKTPSLAVILIGNNPAAKIYVNNKKLACNKVGIQSHEFLLSENSTQEEILSLIKKLNTDNLIDGILLQLPLPKHLDSKLILNTITPSKDVDGFHRYNMGSLILNQEGIYPCTPHGIIYILDSINFNYLGKHAVIIGASNIVGKPMGLELLNRGMTITICNSKTQNIQSLTKLADLIVIAIGIPKFLTNNYLKDNVVVIDVGINRLDNDTICGDADFQNILETVSYITPVPGGVGPMTVAMLIQNTLNCYNLRQNNI